MPWVSWPWWPRSEAAELLLEKIRIENFPDRPSRLRSYFLNYSKEVAEHRMNAMLRGNRQLVRCQLILNSGKYHFADVDIYDQLSGRPDDENLAMKYWQEFNPVAQPEWQRLEVIADSMLYFPDWPGFSVLDPDVLIRWQNSQSK